MTTQDSDISTVLEPTNATSQGQSCLGIQVNLSRLLSYILTSKPYCATKAGNQRLNSTQTFTELKKPIWEHFSKRSDRSCTAWLDTLKKSRVYSN